MLSSCTTWILTRITTNKQRIAATEWAKPGTRVQNFIGILVKVYYFLDPLVEGNQRNFTSFFSLILNAFFSVSCFNRQCWTKVSAYGQAAVDFLKLLGEIKTPHSLLAKYITEKRDWRWSQNRLNSISPHRSNPWRLAVFVLQVLTSEERKKLIQL